MIDLHCHLLPRLDDGSSSPEETRAMLRSAADAGVHTILATPHASGAMERYDAVFPEWRDIAERDFRLTLGEGCEYDYRDLVRIRQHGREGELHYLNGKSTLLLDFAFAMLPPDWTQLLHWPQAEKLEYLLVAHPERLFPDVLQTGRTLFEAGFFLQLNAGSLLGHYGRTIRKRAVQLLDAGLAHVVAGDAHRAGDGKWNLAAVRPLLEKRYGTECTALWLEKNPARLLNGQAARPVRPRLSWYQRLFV